MKHEMVSSFEVVGYTYKLRDKNLPSCSKRFAAPSSNAEDLRWPHIREPCNTAAGELRTPALLQCFHASRPFSSWQFRPENHPFHTGLFSL